MSTCCTVCVRGYPADLPLERVADKLTIHFLRARNGGGEIVNIEFAPQSPDCAMITFEDATAQRVLKTKQHVLAVNGKNYPLEVSAYPTELNPNEIFVRVYMKIDYRCIPNGKDILYSLCQQYGGIHFNFNAQEMTCSVKGSFTELQAFTSELLRCLNSKQRVSISSAFGGRSAEKAEGDGALHQEETQAKRGENEKETAAGPLSARKSAESHVEPLEDFSLVIDADIYLYMQKFCCEEFSNILHRHQVGVVDVISDGIANLYLQTASDEAGGVSSLVSAHLALSQLSQQLEGTLRKEKINKRHLGADGSKGLPRELQSLCPQLLIHEDDGHFCLIGNLVEVSRAKQYVQDLIAGREAAQDHQKPDTPQPAHLPLIHEQRTAAAQLESPAESVPRKLSSPRPNSKSEHKLAAKFSSEASMPPFSNRDTPLAGLLAGDSLQTAKRQAPNNERSLQFLPAAAEPKGQIRQPVEFRQVPQGVKTDPSLAVSGGPMSSREGQMSLRLMEPSSLHHVTSAFRSLNLFDAAGTAEPRPHLRRLSSVSVAEPLSAAQASVYYLKQESQEDPYHTLQKEITKERITQMEEGKEVESQITKQGHSSPPLLTIQRDGGGSSGMQKAEAFPVPPAYIHESFTYSELAMEGPEDEALSDLCRYLKNFDDQVVVSRDRYRLDLVYPCELKSQVLEVFRLFSARRVAALAEQILSRDALQSKIQGETLSTRSPQQLKESRRTSLLENSLGLDSLAGETSPSQVQRSLEASSFQPAVAPNCPSDRKARQSENHDQTPDASKQGCPGKSVAVTRQGLPDKLHFARDCSKEGSSHEAESPPWPFPDPPLGVSSPVSLQVAGKCSPAAREGVASDLGLRTASLGSESMAEECELCQSNHPVLFSAPWTNKPCRTRFPTGSISPPYCSASPAIPGTFRASTISQSLPGDFQHPTLKIIYDIPDGVQQAGDPRPGHPYQGDHFEAFLPDNPVGQRLMVLLCKAFEHSLTFQIKSCGSEDRVIWGPIPHKTCMEGGRGRNGYPDAQYLQCVSLKLKDLNIE
ncbi:uncharacterized protein LOC133367123 isoform X2 [Rhineura floridana]|uniref:uncharacterized protein LOC133367123 isoform X2 n=1 Tax=Rhineura floridana TaxID=261503 RepID=UPI002AC80BEC|nr:uncharacterized protein LOC133367123 isoform X2 [Rhineura floridana]